MIMQRGILLGFLPLIRIPSKQEGPGTHLRIMPNSGTLGTELSFALGETIGSDIKT